MPTNSEIPGNHGLANWASRLDERVARLEERSIHADATAQRLEGAIGRLETAIDRSREQLTVELNRLSTRNEADNQALANEFKTDIATMATEFRTEARAVRGLVTKLLFAVVAGLIALVSGISLAVIQIIWRAVA